MVGSEKKVRIRPDPDPQHCDSTTNCLNASSHHSLYIKTAEFADIHLYSVITLKRCVKTRKHIKFKKKIYVNDETLSANICTIQCEGRKPS